MHYNFFYKWIPWTQKEKKGRRKNILTKWTLLHFSFLSFLNCIIFRNPFESSLNIKKCLCYGRIPFAINRYLISARVFVCFPCYVFLLHVASRQNCHVAILHVQNIKWVSYIMVHRTSSLQQFSSSCYC